MRRQFHPFMRRQFHPFMRQQFHPFMRQFHPFMRRQFHATGFLSCMGRLLMLNWHWTGGKKKKRRDATQMRLRNRSSVEALLPEQWLKLGEFDFPVRREHRSVWGTHIPYIYKYIFPVQW